ncbi:MAG: hypothetical protein EPN47_07985 [Acidobacteria bacterium]|nr:MAG: hypothetical protein EPN47_07985 [Acidobacteriota bacterium]
MMNQAKAAIMAISRTEVKGECLGLKGTVKQIEQRREAGKENSKGSGKQTIEDAAAGNTLETLLARTWKILKRPASGNSRSAYLS